MAHGQLSGHVSAGTGKAGRGCQILPGAGPEQ